jgi:hypothetical protein
VISAAMITTTATPIATPRMVSPARTPFARRDSIAIRNPSSGLMMPAGRRCPIGSLLLFIAQRFDRVHP